MSTALRTEGLSKSFGAFKANSDITLAFETGARHAIIGPNGAGKTTFINLLTGLSPAERGRGLPRRGERDRSAAACARQARHDAHLPDQYALPRAHGARIGGARLLRARRRGRGVVAQRLRVAPADRRSARDPRAASSRAATPTSRRAIFPTASSGCSRSRWRSRRARACCCSTSPPRAFHQRERGALRRHRRVCRARCRSYSSSTT